MNFTVSSTCTAFKTHIQDSDDVPNIKSGITEVVNWVRKKLIDMALGEVLCDDDMFINTL